jgi:uncharacterized protein DUF5995/cyclic nucleotide-binding protein
VVRSGIQLRFEESWDPGSSRIPPPRAGFAQHPSPPGGYSVGLFESYVEAMAKRLDEMLGRKDVRAVFQLTYLTFSKRILEALKAGRFHDREWATDICCRFVEVYLEQLGLWDRRAPEQCATWRFAFAAMEQGRVNVLQAMLLGMNAHIHYDLAFVTLGSCRQAGDLGDGYAGERALSASRSGVPVERYRDFLVVNRIGWESIPVIQDAVLGTFNRWLYWANRLTARATRHFGQRILVESRDASWAQTCLLIHARDDEERNCVARVIDAYASSIADLIGTLTFYPTSLAENATQWRRRWSRFETDVQTGLVEMARRDPVVAELALQQLAFAGADPGPVLSALIEGREPRLAAIYVKIAWRDAPASRRPALVEFLRGGSEAATQVLQAMLVYGGLPAAIAAEVPVERLRHRAALAAEESRRCAAHPLVAEHATLRDALVGYAQRTEARLGPAIAIDDRSRQMDFVSLDDLIIFLTAHPDPWVRSCARVLQGRLGAAMSSLIERVLFLKETPVFMEVEPGPLMQLAETLEQTRFEQGAFLIRNGERSGGIHLLRRGEVEVRQERDGKPVPIARLGENESLGELSALNDIPATADCVALTPVEGYFIRASVLAEALHQHPRLGIGIIRMLSRRLMATTLRLRDSLAN